MPLLQRALIGALAGLFLLIVAGAAQAEKRVALVVGNSNYKLISPLANPVNDAELMTSALREVGFDVVTVKDADRRKLARAISDFGSRLGAAGADAVGLFYYAGHGVQAGGANYLIPLDAPIDRELDLEIEAVSVGWVLRQMEVAGNSLNLVVLDACRNNPFKRSFRSANRGLARMEAPTGSYISYAAAPGEVARDGRGSNSPYTAALVEAMREPGLKLEDTFKRVRIAVRRETSGQQTPWEEGSLLGDFYFVPQGSTVTVTPPQPQSTFDERAFELAFWDAIKDSADPANFEDYLARYPDGAFIGLAKRRLATLTKVAALPPATPGYEIDEIDETYYALKRANVRVGPGTSYDKVARLSVGDEVDVMGRVAEGNWLRVALVEGGTGYVYAPLLGEVKPGDTQVAVGVFPAGRKAGDVFQDCADCPEMVVIPQGSFRMGDLSGAGDDDEKPVHYVRIGYSFAVGKYEVTFEQWDACAMDGGCDGYLPDDVGWGRGRRPVLYISWNDAQAYVQWLKEKTGQSYRLLSESEWEYMARAGTTTQYSWGEKIGRGNANCDGCGSKWDNRQTAPVGSFSANAFGVHDVHGNVVEWVEDCVNETYSGAPLGGEVWTSSGPGAWVPPDRIVGVAWDNREFAGGTCKGMEERRRYGSLRVYRGGAWSSEPKGVRSAHRRSSESGYRYSGNGLRVARTLP